MKWAKKVVFVNRLLPVLYFISLAGCHQILEARVENSGSTLPRNHREQIIFDYYHALLDERYEDAYQLRAWHLSPSQPNLEGFGTIHAEENKSLPTKISIGEERKYNPDQASDCSYHYTVYTAYPNTSILTSGEISIHPNPDDPDTCLIGYNSAFGSLP